MPERNLPPQSSPNGSPNLSVEPKVILDVMGGDHGPRIALEGAQSALPHLVGELVLIANAEAANELETTPELATLAAAVREGNSRKGCRVRVVLANENIDMADSIRAIRSKPGASINVGCRMAAEDWKAWKAGSASQPSAFVSAGHSGAMMASALMNMGRLRGAERPAIAVRLPTLTPDGCVLLDVGANVDCKPEHLRDFSVMGALYAQVERQQPGLPKVGVLSNGEEKSKGNELTRAACELIRQMPCFADPAQAVGEFVGYAEGKEMFKGHVDVVVTDGFVGNVVLKSLEGLGSGVVTILKNEAKKSWLTKLGFLLSTRAFGVLKKRLDYAEYGAAPLLGVNGYAFICHGRSDARAIRNALIRTQSAQKNRLVERLEEALATATDLPTRLASATTKPDPQPVSRLETLNK